MNGEIVGLCRNSCITQKLLECTEKELDYAEIVGVCRKRVGLRRNSWSIQKKELDYAEIVGLRRNSWGGQKYLMCEKIVEVHRNRWGEQK